MKIKTVILFICSVFVIACSPPEKGIINDINGDIAWLKLNIKKYNKGDYRFFKAGAWDGEKFILITEKGKVVISEDGIDWSEMTVKVDGDINDIAIVNGVTLLKIGYWWSAIDINGSWQPLVNTKPKTTTPIWDGKHYISFSDNMKYISSDLKEWQEQKIKGLPKVPERIIFHESKFIAHVKYQKNYASKDGITWEPMYPDSRTIYMTFWEDKLYGVADNLPMVRVLEGGEWKSVFRPKLGPTAQDKGLLALDRLFSFGAHISWTNNGKAWGSYNVPGHDEVLHIINGNKKYLAIGTGDLLLLGVTESERVAVKKAVDKFNMLENTIF